MNHNSLSIISSKLLSGCSTIGHYITIKHIALRCPRYSGTDKEEVEKHKNDIQSKIGVEHLIIADQTHTDTFHEITQDNISQEFWGDALYTKEKGIALFVLASDCVPIIFYDTNLQVVGAIHAGRAGLEKNIIQKTFSEISEKYGSRISDFRVFIGPHICQSCYEVGESEVTTFRERYSEQISESKNIGKYLLDIGAIALKQIEELGVPDSQIEYSELCTYEEKELFHSYRRKTHTGDENYGNNGFGIWLK